MKKLLLVLLVAALLSGSAMSQWTYVEDFKTGPSPHGLVVDGNGRIWIGFYAYTDTLGMPADTIPVAPIYVYEPDGSAASFSPITFLTVGGVTDTIDTYCRGLSLDNNGNILFVGNQVLYRINYQTGEGMTKYLYPYASGSLTSAGCDDEGYIYLTKVVPGGDPLVILDEDFVLYGFVLDSCFTIQRAVVVSPTGNDVYMGRIYGAGGLDGVLHYHSDNGADGPYVAVDTLWTSIWGQCVDWDNNGLLWVGSYWDAGANDLKGWYALDPTQDYAIIDTIGHSAGAFVAGEVPAGGTYYSPRHVAWSADGLTMYTNDFDGGVVKKWTNSSPAQPGDPAIMSVDEQILRTLPLEFSLWQNYPNPFNPTTAIPFDLLKKGYVELKVYDVMGREVITLIGRPMVAGRHEVVFDGSDRSSGVYYYQLRMGRSQETKKMLLIK